MLNEEFTTSRNIRNFTYIEDITRTNFPNETVTITDVKAYDDGTALVRITRRNSSLSSEYCVEQLLSLRVIHLNGTITEININNTDLNLNPINYCLFISAFNSYVTNPIRIYPLQNQFILVHYMNTINSSDITTYEDWGMVIDWSGRVYSKLNFGQSFVYNNYWFPDYSITTNINKKLGFIRVSAR